LRNERRTQTRTVPEWNVLSRIVLGRRTSAIFQAAAFVRLIVAAAIVPKIVCFIGFLDTGSHRAGS
jgi:hypothetical protein